MFYPKLNAGRDYFWGLSETPVSETTISKLLSFGRDQISNPTSRWQTISDIRNSDLCKTANNLISDSGEILGKFVIISITENQTFFDKKGIPQKVEFSLTLKRTPGVSNSFVGLDGSNSIVDKLTNIARSYLRW